MKLHCELICLKVIVSQFTACKIEQICLCEFLNKWTTVVVDRGLGRRREGKKPGRAELQN